MKSIARRMFVAVGATVLAGAAQFSNPVAVRANGFPQQWETWVAASGTPIGGSAGTSCAQPGFVTDGVNDQEEISDAIRDVYEDGIVHLCSGTYHLSAGIGYSKSFTIDGAGRDATFVVGSALFGEDGSYASGGSEFLYAGLPVDISLSDLTIRGFYGETRGALSGSGFSISRVRMDHNGVTDGSGGALSGNGAISIADSEFSANYASAQGGAAFFGSGSNVTISGSLFDGNETGSSIGGAIRFFATYATVTDSIFRDNVATQSGGAFDAYAGELTVARSTFSGNRAYGYGGAIVSFLQHALTIERSRFTDNFASGSGGAVLQYATTGTGVDGRPLLTIRRNVFLRNESGQGGGALSTDGGDYLHDASNADVRGIWANEFKRNRAIDGGAILFAVCHPVVPRQVLLLQRQNRFSGNRSIVGRSKIYAEQYYSWPYNLCPFG